jgi:hypothetical protein
MPLYQVRRDIGDVSQDDLDASAYRAIICAYQFPEIRWVRSFWNRAAGQITCFYEARDPEQLTEHARLSRIPCDEVREVTEVLPEPYIHG